MYYLKEWIEESMYDFEGGKMTNKTIIVKRIYKKEGTKKDGTTYTLTKLLADGYYFVTFKPIPNEIKEGSTVELDCVPSDRENTYDILRIISYTAPGNMKAEQKAEVASNPGSSQPPPPATQEESPEIALAKRLDIAVDLLCKKFNLKPEEVNPDSVVLAEILRQLYGQEWLKKEI